MVTIIWSLNPEGMLIFLIWLIYDYQSYIDDNVFDLSKFFITCFTSVLIELCQLWMREQNLKYYKNLRWYWILVDIYVGKSVLYSKYFHLFRIFETFNIWQKIIFKFEWIKEPAGFYLMAYTFVLNALTQCATWTSLGKKMFLKILLHLIFYFDWKQVFVRRSPMPP